MGRGALGIVILHEIDPRAHGIMPHQSGIIRLENLLNSREVFHFGIQPQVVLVGCHDDGHAVMDVGQKSVVLTLVFWIRDNRKGLRRQASIAALVSLPVLVYEIWLLGFHRLDF